MESRELMQIAERALEDKKAQRVQTFHMEKKTILADYYVVCSGTSSTHIKALADGVEEELKKTNTAVLRKEGYEAARWVLLDCGTVIVHILNETDREYFKLESLFERGYETERR